MCGQEYDVDEEEENYESMIDPNTFSLPVDTSQYNETAVDLDTCNTVPGKKPLMKYLKSTPATKIQHLRKGMEQTRHHYAFYREASKNTHFRFTSAQITFNIFL